jgi:ribosomal protein L11 methyltransferase
MEALERWVEPDHIVLDVGTGSGILALAARLLGARQVIACDIDPVAVQVALANVARNDEHEISTICGSVDCIAQHTINLLLGNLNADVIVELFPEFDRVVSPSGLAIFSGVLNEQREDVLDACRRFRFTVHEEIASGEWLALVTEKHVA